MHLARTASRPRRIDEPTLWEAAERLRWALKGRGKHTDPWLFRLAARYFRIAFKPKAAQRCARKFHPPHYLLLQQKRAGNVVRTLLRSPLRSTQSTDPICRLDLPTRPSATFREKYCEERTPDPRPHTVLPIQRRAWYMTRSGGVPRAVRSRFATFIAITGRTSSPSTFKYVWELRQLRPVEALL